MAHTTRIRPDGLPENPAFAPGVSVTAANRTIYVGGQNGIGADGAVVGADIGAQTAQALRNVEAVLTAADAVLTDVVYWRIAMVQGAALRDGFAAFMQEWAGRGEPPAISVDIVAGLANPDFLVEITAIAAV